MDIHRSVTGVNPFPIVLTKDGSFPALLEIRTGDIFVYYCAFNSGTGLWELVSRVSNDNGTTWTSDGSETIISTDILEGEIGASEFPTGRIFVTYWTLVVGVATKTYNFSDDAGVTWGNETAVSVT